MLFVRHVLRALLFVGIAAAVVPQTVSETVYTTTTIDHAQRRQEVAASLPTATLTSMEVITSTLPAITLSRSTKTVHKSNSSAPGAPVTTSSSRGPVTSWSTMGMITSTSSTVSWSTCQVTATCKNATTDSNGKLVIPIPIPILIIIQQVSPVVLPPDEVEVPDENPEEQKPSLSISLSFSRPSFSISFGKKSSTSTGSFSSTSSLTSSSSTGSVSSTGLSTSFTSTMSPTSTSSSAASSTSAVGDACPVGGGLILDDEEGDNFNETEPSSTTSTVGASCPTGVNLNIDEDEGDNFNATKPDSCQKLSLDPHDEDDNELGDDWNDFGPSSIIPIPTLAFRTTSSAPSSSSTSSVTSKPPAPSSSEPSKPSSIAPLPSGYYEYKCENIRTYSGRNSMEECRSDDYCRSWEWWGPPGEDPYAKKSYLLDGPADSHASNYAKNTTWDGYERTCEPVQQNPKASWCKSCRRNPGVCKIIRTWAAGDKSPSPLEACWADEICESDRDHSRLCHLATPYKGIDKSHDGGAFCMECPRNAPYDPDKKGCMPQIDFIKDGRQEFNSYVGDIACPSHCKSDDYARRYCTKSPHKDFDGMISQCMSCPL